MADEDGIYGGEDHDRFEAEEFDQDYVDGGIREDVSISPFSCDAVQHFIQSSHKFHSWISTMLRIEWRSLMEVLSLSISQRESQLAT